MKAKVKSFIALIITLSVIMGISVVSVSAANTTSDYNKYNAPSSSDYVYWNGTKMVRATSTTDSEVMWIQASMNFLIDKGVISGRNLEKLVVEKSFGPKSSAMTKLFQKAVGLKQDGSFGKDSIAAMKTELKFLEEKAKPTRTSTSQSTTSTNSYTNNSIGYKSNGKYYIYWPVSKSVFSKDAKLGSNSDFGGPRTVGSKYHKGIDLAISSGNAVYSVAKGVVCAKGYTNYRGNYVVIYHKDLGISSLYEHMSSISVNLKDTVTAGQTIGKSGNSGYLDGAAKKKPYGAHLHFGLINGDATNNVDRDQSYAFDPKGSNIVYTYVK